MTLLRITLLLLQAYRVIHACEKYSFIKEQDVEFKDHLITTMTTPYVELCWDKCVWIMDCFSVNARNTAFGTIECDLNNSSKKASPVSLVPTQGSQYYQFGEVKDCLTCECKRKEDLGDGWYRLGNSALKLFLENKNWTDARAHCHSLGGDLVSIATEYENRFTHGVLAKKSSFKKRDLYLEDNLAADMVNFWLLNGTDSNVTLLGNPGAARYETTDGERALYLSGHNSYARVPAVKFNTAGFTFMIWVKPKNQSIVEDIIYGDWIPARTFILKISRNEKWLRFKIYNDASASYKVGTEISAILDQWFHVAITWNMSQRSLLMFVNGMKTDETIFDHQTTVRVESKEYFLLGLKDDQVQSVGSTFHGYLKHLMVFKRSLRAEEIQTVMYWSDEGPWIGLHAQENVNTFAWPGGKEIQFRALPLYSPQPLLSGRKCFGIGEKGHWFDKHCHQNKTYVCEKNIV